MGSYYCRYATRPVFACEGVFLAELGSVNTLPELYIGAVPFLKDLRYLYPFEAPSHKKLLPAVLMPVLRNKEGVVTPGRNSSTGLYPYWAETFFSKSNPSGSG